MQMRQFQAGRLQFGGGEQVLGALRSSAAQREAGVNLINRNIQQLNAQLQAEQAQARAEEAQAAQAEALKGARKTLDSAAQTHTLQRSSMTPLGDVLGQFPDRGEQLQYLQRTFNVQPAQAERILRYMDERVEVQVVDGPSVASAYRGLVEAGMSGQDAMREIELIAPNGSVSIADAAQGMTEEVNQYIGQIQGQSSDFREQGAATFNAGIRQMERNEARQFDQQQELERMQALQAQTRELISGGLIREQDFVGNVPALPEGTPNIEANQALLNAPQSMTTLGQGAEIAAMLSARNPAEMAAVQQLGQMFPTDSEAQSMADRESGRLREQSMRTPFGGVSDAGVGALMGGQMPESQLQTGPMKGSLLDLSALPVTPSQGMKNNFTFEVEYDASGRPIGVDVEPSADLSPTHRATFNAVYRDDIKAIENSLKGSTLLEFLADNSTASALGKSAAMQAAGTLGPKPTQNAPAPPMKRPWETLGVVEAP